jgi:AcrR family transcriptional regulator
VCQNIAMTLEHSIPTAPGIRRRAGRPRSNSSREKILAVARLAFPANGYADTSLRGIARDAGVDPSLVVQLFGSKAGLFAAAVEWPFDASMIAAEIRDESAENVGYYVARIFVSHWERDEHRNPIISLIHAALADPAAAAMLREFITVNLTLPMVERVNADRPQLRAALLASQLLGFGLSRYALAFEALTSASADELTGALGSALQHTCTDPLSATR